MNQVEFPQCVLTVIRSIGMNFIKDDIVWRWKGEKKSSFPPGKHNQIMVNIIRSAITLF